MRTVRAFEILSIAVPLALASCSKETDQEAKSPSGSTTYGYDANSASTTPAQPSDMTPASRTEEAPATIPPSADQGAAPEAQATTTLNDAQIVALTDAANTAEVDAAKYALQKAKNAKVRKFAQMMIDHHGKAQRDQAKLVSKLGMTPEESTKLRDLKTSATDTDRTLKAAPDDMFDKIYIDIQVADHQMVLDSLDRDFIPKAQNAELKKSLQDFRPKVEQHLNQALELQKTLMSSSTSGAKATSGSGSSSNKTGTGTGSSDNKTGTGTGSSDNKTGTGSGSGTSSGSTTR